ncbi:hypothetical protein L2E82_11562 [Cichorium intybus]|uniref:Uncharacterized protein n=1 Tax=Cichorium intybus TaxID=13427 RepID=A0ACB9GDN5_CICIN|nr:hypothetical protein L2E82_11562 [Cichorium intybus]
MEQRRLSFATPSIFSGTFTKAFSNSLSSYFVHVRFHHVKATVGRRKIEKMEPVEAAAELRSHFIRVLRSRRSLEVPLEVLPAKPVLEPLYQGTTPAMESVPKVDINFKEILIQENFYLTTEEGDQGRLPVLILSMKEDKPSKRPAVVFLHPSDTNKEFLRPLQEGYASRGYITIAIDSRYHGERAKDSNTYQDALVSSWKRGDTMPFIYDTVWDLVKLADYLTKRDDIDHSRIGINGISLGGMHAWFAAFVDTRYSVVVPIISVQDFRWAIDNDQWQARVDSMKPVFEGEIDPRCPIEGLNHTISRTQKAFKYAQCSDNFKVIVEAGIGHELTSSMVKEASDWFDKFLKP